MTRRDLRLAVLAVAMTLSSAGCTSAEDEPDPALEYWYTGYECDVFDPSSLPPFSELPAALELDPNSGPAFLAGEPGERNSSAEQTCVYSGRWGDAADHSVKFSFVAHYGDTVETAADRAGQYFDPGNTPLGELGEVPGHEGRWDRVGFGKASTDSDRLPVSARLSYVFLDGNLDLLLTVETVGDPIDDRLQDQILEAALACAEAVRARSDYDFDTAESGSPS